MVRNPDFVHGIHPKSGDYDYIVKSEKVNRVLQERVNSIAYGFEWNSEFESNTTAIAVDMSEPCLIAHFRTDSGDPNKRKCHNVKIWILSDSDKIEDYINELWHEAVNYDISRSDFLLEIKDKKSGKFIVGSNKSFKARNYDQAWGAHKSGNNTLNDIYSDNLLNDLPRIKHTHDQHQYTSVSSTLLKCVLILLFLTGTLSITYFIYINNNYYNLMAINKSLENELTKSTTLIKSKDSDLQKISIRIEELNFSLKRNNEEIKRINEEKLSLLRENDQLKSLYEVNPVKMNHAKIIELKGDIDKLIRTLTEIQVKLHNISESDSSNPEQK